MLHCRIHPYLVHADHHRVLEITAVHRYRRKSSSLAAENKNFHRQPNRREPLGGAERRDSQERDHPDRRADNRENRRTFCKFFPCVNPGCLSTCFFFFGAGSESNSLSNFDFLFRLSHFSHQHRRALEPQLSHANELKSFEKDHFPIHFASSVAVKFVISVWNEVRSNCSRASFNISPSKKIFACQIENLFALSLPISFL